MPSRRTRTNVYYSFTCRAERNYCGGQPTKKTDAYRHGILPSSRCRGRGYEGEGAGVRAVIEKIKMQAWARPHPLHGRPPASFLCVSSSVFSCVDQRQNPLLWPRTAHHASSLHVCSHGVSDCVKGHLLSMGGGLPLPFLPAPLTHGLNRAPHQRRAPHWRRPERISSPGVSDSHRSSLCTWCGCLGSGSKRGGDTCEGVSPHYNE